MERFNSAGRMIPRAGLHGDEESAAEEAVAAAVEWNMISWLIQKQKAKSHTPHDG